MIVYVQLL